MEKERVLAWYSSFGNRRNLISTMNALRVVSLGLLSIELWALFRHLNTAPFPAGSAQHTAFNHLGRALVRHPGDAGRVPDQHLFSAISIGVQGEHIGG